MDALKTAIAEIKEWYAIVYDFIFAVLSKAGLDVSGIPEEVKPQ